jgi:hypothetical protein
MTFARSLEPVLPVATINATGFGLVVPDDLMGVGRRHQFGFTTNRLDDDDAEFRVHGVDDGHLVWVWLLNVLRPDMAWHYWTPHVLRIFQPHDPRHDVREQ